MAALLKFMFWVSLAATVVSCWKHDEFLVPLDVLPALDAEPVQTPTRRQPFTVSSNGVSYRIDPLHQYDLHGLVVSFRHHDGQSRLHRLWNDHLNVADLCVVWGRNARLPDLNVYAFRNAQFTCYVEAPTRASWAQFDTRLLSNNHVLTDKAHLRALIESVEVGDQIRLTGMLAEYSNDTGFRRGSSTVRDDQGNGACETIYAESFAILRPMQSFWRSLLYPAGIAALLSALLWLVGVGAGRF